MGDRMSSQMKTKLGEGLPTVSEALVLTHINQM